jgi:hypothetical protein
MDQVIAGVIHHQTIHRATALSGTDHDDFGSIRLGKAPGQGVTDHERGEILVFEIYPMPGRCDGVKIEGLDLPNLQPRVASRLRASNAHRKIRDVGLEIFGPSLAGIADRVELHAGRPPPAFPYEVAERCRRRTIHGDLDIVAGPENAAIRCSPTLMYRQVFRGIPTISSEVATAAEGDRIVND